MLELVDRMPRQYGSLLLFEWISIYFQRRMRYVSTYAARLPHFGHWNPKQFQVALSPVLSIRSYQSTHLSQFVISLSWQMTLWETGNISLHVSKYLSSFAEQRDAQGGVKLEGFPRLLLECGSECFITKGHSQLTCDRAEKFILRFLDCLNMIRNVTK